MEVINACVIGLKNKNDVINTLYELLKKIGLEEKKKIDEFFFTVLQYFDEYRNRDYFVLNIGGLQDDEYYSDKKLIYIKNKINVRYFFYPINCRDYYNVLTKHAKKIIEKVFNINPISHFKNKVIYIENNKKLVVSDITKICCDNVKMNKFETLVSSNINPGVYNIRDKSIFNKILRKRLYERVKETVEKGWNPTPISYEYNIFSLTNE